ncbi:hypothetical protein [Synechococcus sp. PCC 7336]|nr:hypothetical protein [Synechococcus sp. PCC 7336]
MDCDTVAKPACDIQAGRGENAGKLAGDRHGVFRYTIPLAAVFAGH